MKANVLMIGDWVAQPVNDEPCKVVSLMSDIELDDGGFYEEVEPIPLTPEILEKNGFVKQDYDGWVISKDFARRFISYRTDYFDGLLKIQYAEEPFCDLCLEIKYVHELQHALTLCGIEKEIKL